MIDRVFVLAMGLAFFGYCVWRRVDLLERRQAEREEARVRLLVELAGQAGSVKGVTELLAGLLAQMNAKLDRQVAAPIQASVS